MPFYKHGNLTHFLTHNTLSYSTVLSIAIDIALALEYLASFDVVHRDLKPENILIDDGPSNESFKAVVGDFGISRVVAATMTTTQMGTRGCITLSLYVLCLLTS
jgi:serine/threonine protein kinase